MTAGEDDVYGDATVTVILLDVGRLIESDQPVAATDEIGDR